VKHTQHTQHNSTTAQQHSSLNKLGRPPPQPKPHSVRRLTTSSATTLMPRTSPYKARWISTRFACKSFWAWDNANKKQTSTGHDTTRHHHPTGATATPCPQASTQHSARSGPVLRSTPSRGFRWTGTHPRTWRCWTSRHSPAARACFSWTQKVDEAWWHAGLSWVKRRAQKRLCVLARGRVNVAADDSLPLPVMGGRVTFFIVVQHTLCRSLFRSLLRHFSATAPCWFCYILGSVLPA